MCDAAGSTCTGATGGVGDLSSDFAALDRLFLVAGAVAAVRAAVKVMGEGGRIISIGSSLGSHSPWPGLADYSASKAALGGYTRGWARDLGPKASQSILSSPARSTPT